MPRQSIQVCIKTWTQPSVSAASHWHFDNKVEIPDSQIIKEGKEAFEDEINVNIDKTEDVDDASKHGIEKIDVEICVFVENTVSKCSVLTESSTSTQTPPSPKLN